MKKLRPKQQQKWKNSQGIKLNAGDRFAGWQILKVIKESHVTRYVCRCICGTETVLAGIMLWNRVRLDCGCGIGSKALKPANSKSISQGNKGEVDEIRWLVEEGYLPKPDAHTITEGEPAWGIDSIAQILGVDAETLIQLLSTLGERFASGSRMSTGDEADGRP